MIVSRNRPRVALTGDDPYRSASHGRPTALWCLARWVTPAAVVGYWTEESGSLFTETPGHVHICKVDVYRNADHVHECACGERES